MWLLRCVAEGWNSPAPPSWVDISFIAVDQSREVEWVNTYVAIGLFSNSVKSSSEYLFCSNELNWFFFAP